MKHTYVRGSASLSQAGVISLGNPRVIREKAPGSEKNGSDLRSPLYLVSRSCGDGSNQQSITKLPGVVGVLLC